MSLFLYQRAGPLCETSLQEEVNLRPQTRIHIVLLLQFVLQPLRLLLYPLQVRFKLGILEFMVFK